MEIEEVHRGECNRIRLTDRDESLIGRKIDGGIQPELMVKDVAVALSVEVEVGVVGQIDDRLPVAPGSQSQLKGILIAPHVMGYHFQIAGIAGLSVLREI